MTTGGKWLLLFTHPAKVTTVCITEFLAFARSWSVFKKLNCELLGLSTDRHFSPVNLIRNIREAFGVDIPFPLIKSQSLRLEAARAYGMTSPGTSRHFGYTSHIHH